MARLFVPPSHRRFEIQRFSRARSRICKVAATAFTGPCRRQVRQATYWMAWTKVPDPDLPENVVFSLPAQSFLTVSTTFAIVFDSPLQARPGPTVTATVISLLASQMH